MTQQFGGHLDVESLFLFCGRRTDRIKALYNNRRVQRNLGVLTPMEKHYSYPWAA